MLTLQLCSKLAGTVMCVAVLSINSIDYPQHKLLLKQETAVAKMIRIILSFLPARAVSDRMCSMLYVCLRHQFYHFHEADETNEPDVISSCQ